MLETPHAERSIDKPDDTDEFSNLARLHMPVIHRFILASVRNPDLAETLTQECFLKAYRYRSSFRGESSIRTWLMHIAINLQKDYWRNRRLQFWREVQVNAVDVEIVSDRLPSAERSPEAQMLTRERTAQIWRIVEGLSKRERSIFLLRYVEELPLREIGQRTGLKVGTVKAHLAHATSKIRVALGTGDRC